MSFFSRNNQSVVSNCHSYITEKPTLHNIGLASYTRNTLEKFGKERRNGSDVISAEIEEYFSNTYSSLKPKLLGDSGSTLSIMKFDKQTKKYTLVTGTEIFNTPSGSAASSLSDFQTKFDTWQKGFYSADTTANKDLKWKLQHVWSNIQNSMSGCITFGITYTVLTCQESSLVKLYFQSGGKADTVRSVAHKDKIIIAAPPRTPTGEKLSFADTQETEPGYNVPAREGGSNNPKNPVAGELKLHYDPATGKWESGTTLMMFDLLTDIDGVPAKDLPRDVDATNLDAFYSGPLSSKFTIGSGMVVGTENGNPHLFGPKSNGCGPSPKTKVLMVNRTPRSFTAGERVIGSLINGEWIPIGLGPAKVVSKKLDVEWSQIQKYIVDAKSFWRNESDTRFITPDEYSNHVRFKFYSSLSTLSNAGTLQASGNDLDRIALINLLQPNVSSLELNPNGTVKLSPEGVTIQTVDNYNLYMNLVPSTGYLQFYDADVLKTTLGGNNTANRIKKANISQTDNDVEGEVYAENVTASWGMYFPQGYSSSTTSRLKAYANGINVSSAFSVAGGQYGNTFPIYQNATLDFSAAENDSFSISDPNMYHLPAQFALNSSGNQSLYLPILWHTLKNSNANGLVTYFKDPLKGDYLVANGNKTVYGLSPLNPTTVQFTPLSLQLALCSTIVPNNSDKDINGGYADLGINLSYQNWTKDHLGKAWQRLQLPDAGFLLGTTDTTRGNIGFGKRLLKIGSNGQITIDTPARNDIPDGGPGILPQYNGDELSNVVGLIGARATLNLSAGGQIALKTNNHFGLNAYGSVGGGGGFLSFIPTMFGLVPGADGRSEIKQYQYVSWGSSEGQSDDLRAFGTIALWCSIYDHCPNTVYDARYFTPIQMHSDTKDLNGDAIDIDMVAKQPRGSTRSADKTPIAIGTTINQFFTDTVTTIKNPIRRNMLLTGGGFYYIQRVLAAKVSSISITHDPDVQTPNYSEGDVVTFAYGNVPAIFKVSEVSENGTIIAIKPDTKNLGLDAYGEFSGNPFKDGPIEGTISSNGNGCTIKLREGIVIEKVKHDVLKKYSAEKILTPSDNNGGGDDYGYVRSSKNTTFSLESNQTGKYDIFLFFANDIMVCPENTAGANGALETNPFAQYVNLEISAN